MTAIEITVMAVPPVASLILVCVAFAQNDSDRKRRELLELQLSCEKHEIQSLSARLIESHATVEGLAAELLKERGENESLRQQLIDDFNEAVELEEMK